ncbi:UDP-N-acetylmuramoyl-L-alanine--D-glutamate ligase [Candidatus Gracilibacteria bacterium]|nr:UDP-N-acetylmuramoyl-L-alanine--D-glutamate ligase [Candidatus Gracilibacteria bacterium]
MKFSLLASNAKILIYGYGDEGRSTEKFFKENYPQFKISLFDENKTEPEFLKPGFKFQDFDLIVRSPGVPREKIDAPTNKITSQVELFFENLSESERQKTIGITGTKGKSTTTKFCAELLQNTGRTVAIAGNFGVPPLDVLPAFQKGEYDFVILELSSFQLEHLSNSPHIAILLNLYRDHLERHQTVEKYHAAKSNLFRHQHADDFLIVPEETGAFLDMTLFKGRCIFSSTIQESLFPETSVFRALHFRQNFGTMKSLCDILKIPETLLQKTAHEFQGLPHRMEIFTEKNGIQFVNDSIASNPSASLAAVKFFGKKLGSIILGGRPSGDSWTELLQVIKTQTNALVLLPDGDSLEVIQKTLADIQFPHQRVIHQKNFEEIVEAGLSHTPKGKVCLLSPGAKSFDKFPNYKEKGNTFKKLVNAL